MENKITFVYQTIPLQYVLNVFHLYPGGKTAELIITGSITKKKHIYLSETDKRRE